MYECFACKYVCDPICDHGDCGVQKRVLNTLKLEFKWLGITLRVLETEFGSFARTTNALNPWANSPAPKQCFLFLLRNGLESWLVLDSWPLESHLICGHKTTYVSFNRIGKSLKKCQVLVSSWSNPGVLTVLCQIWSVLRWAIWSLWLS